jgi:hypothetical protein
MGALENAEASHVRIKNKSMSKGRTQYTGVARHRGRVPKSHAWVGPLSLRCALHPRPAPSAAPRATSEHPPVGSMQSTETATYAGGLHPRGTIRESARDRDPTEHSFSTSTNKIVCPRSLVLFRAVRRIICDQFGRARPGLCEEQAR